MHIFLCFTCMSGCPFVGSVVLSVEFSVRIQVENPWIPTQ